MNAFRWAIRSEALILLVPALFFPGQRQPQPQQKIPRHDAAAVVKLVPVRVLDTAGNPVIDLKKEDFVLFDNKERKVITEFEVHRLQRIPANLDLAGPELGTTPVPEMGRKYFLYLDIQGSDANGTANAKKAAIEFVETRLLPGDEAALLYYASMTGLNMVEYLTGDRAKLKKAIERAREMGAGQYGGTLSAGYGMISEQVAVMSPPQSRAAVDAKAGEVERGLEADVGGGVVVIPRANVDAGNAAAGAPAATAVPSLALFGRRGPDFVESMGELANALRYIPGAKTIVFFSARTAIPKELARAFAATNTPLFAVNTQNWIVQGGVRQKYLWIEHPLKAFAEASGGRYFSDVTAVQAVASDIQTFSANYYVVGYYVNLEWDGKAHQIEVQVARPGAQVFVQEGYSNPKPFAEWSDVEKKLQIYDLAFADRPASKDALDLPVRTLIAPDGKGRNGVVLAGLAVDEKTGIPPGRAELFVFVFEKGGQAVRALRTEMDFAKLAGRTICPYVSIPLPAGEYEARFVARDPATGHAAAGMSAFTVPAAAGKGVRFSTPLLIVTGREPNYLKLNWPGRNAEASTIAEFYPFLPKNGGPLVGPLRAGEKTLLAVLTAEFPAAAAAPKMNLDFRLTNAAGDAFPVGTRIVESKKVAATRSALALEIDLPALAPGDYVLEITAVDSGTKTAHVMRSPFTVI
jgi:VWFA-related protein